MRKSLFVLALCALLALPGGEARAAGHYGVGGEGYKSSSLPTEGFWWKMYNLYYTAKRFNNDSGSKSGHGNIDQFTHLQRFILPIMHFDAIGADWVADIVIPFTWTRINSNGWSRNDHGVGDILIEPIILSWHQPWFDAVLGITIYAPTGEYDEDKQLPGLNFWSFLPTAGITLYLDKEKTWSISALSRYEFNTENNTTNVRDGQSITLEWAIGKNFMGMFDVAIAGADKWQVTDSHGRMDGLGRDADHWRDEVHAIGPELGFTYAPWKLNLGLRCLWEYYKTNGPQGMMTLFTITKGF